ncbi:J domain-containing protein [Phormidesmis sp. 146-33]
MAHSNHYQILDVEPNATQAEIKQAYRRLAKLFHPDSNSQTANHDKITQINAAYEVLGDPQSRNSYDRHLSYYSRLGSAGYSAESVEDRQQRDAAAQAHYRRKRQTEPDSDQHLKVWLNKVYTPVNRQLGQIIRPLRAQIKQLSADPFDDELMEAFQAYTEDCRQMLGKAQTVFRSFPNPPTVAGVAANLYYCLNQVADGIEELEYFSLNYDDHHLNTGLELFKIAEGLRREAQAAFRELPK